MVIQSGSTTRSIFDADGAGHDDSPWVMLNTHDNIALLDALELTLTADPIRASFGDFIESNVAQLRALGLVHEYGPEERRVMINFTRLIMLDTRAIRQFSDRITRLESERGM
jgi:hypothetical protein